MNVSTGTQPTNGTSGRSSSQVITLSGVSQPAQLNVIYGPGSQPVVNQATPALVDAIIGLGISQQASGPISASTISSMAKNIVAGNYTSLMEAFHVTTR